MATGARLNLNDRPLNLFTNNSGYEQLTASLPRYLDHIWVGAQLFATRGQHFATRRQQDYICSTNLIDRPHFQRAPQPLRDSHSPTCTIGAFQQTVN